MTQTAETPHGQPVPEQPMLSPKQEAMLAAYNLSPGSPEAQAMLAAMEGGAPLPTQPQEAGTSTESYNPYAHESAAEATEQLATIERRAIDATAGGQKDALHQVEEAEHSSQVEKARHHVEEVFGEDTAKQALEKAIGDSSIQTQNSSEVAEAVVKGHKELNSSDTLIKKDMADVDNTAVAKSKYAELKDLANGRTDKILNTVAERADYRMRRFGIRKKRAELSAEAVESAGKTITSAKEGLATEQALVGEAVVAALANNKPRLSGGKRKALLEALQKQPGNIKRVGEAIHHYRKGHHDLRAYRKVGKVFENIK